MKSSSYGLVSIVVPAYNAGRFLHDTIHTVKSQSYENWELIFVDDHSTDKTVSIIRSYQKNDPRIKLFHTPKNSGAAAARNIGIEEAKGEYLAFLDADDLWLPQKLQRQLSLMQGSGGAFCYSGYEFADENGIPNGKKVIVPEEISYANALRRSAISTITVLIDLQKIDKHDIFMPAYPIGEDAATWWGLLRKYGTAYAVPEVMALYRRSNSGTLSANKAKAILWRWRLYRKHEKLSFILSAYYFYHYIIYAVSRRV